MLVKTNLYQIRPPVKQILLPPHQPGPIMPGMWRTRLLTTASVSLLLLVSLGADEAQDRFPRGGVFTQYRNWADFGIGSTASYRTSGTTFSHQPDVADQTRRGRLTLTLVEGRLGKRELRVDSLAFKADGEWT